MKLKHLNLRKRLNLREKLMRIPLIIFIGVYFFLLPKRALGFNQYCVNKPVVAYVNQPQKKVFNYLSYQKENMNHSGWKRNTDIKKDNFLNIFVITNNIDYVFVHHYFSNNSNITTNYQTQVSNQFYSRKLRNFRKHQNFETNFKFKRQFKYKTGLLNNSFKPIFPNVKNKESFLPKILKLQKQENCKIEKKTSLSFLLNFHDKKTIFIIFKKAFFLASLKNMLICTTKTTSYNLIFQPQFLFSENGLRKKNNYTLTLTCFCPGLINDYVICSKQNDLNIPIGTVGYITQVLEYPLVKCQFNVKHFSCYNSKQKQILFESVATIEGSGLIVTEYFLSKINFPKRLIDEEKLISQ